VQKGKCYRNFANYKLIRLNRFILIKLYLILLISIQTSDMTGSKILPFTLLPFAVGSKQHLRCAVLCVGACTGFARPAFADP
jgi:hypothetical protein